jgi:hypothetical protein
LSLAPLASVTCWRGRSTARPFHYGFTIETFEATEPINPGNVSFFFVIFSEPPRAE